MPYKNKPTARPKAPIKGARTTQSGSVGRTTRGATLGSGWLCRDSRSLTEVALKYHTDIHEHGSWRRGLARAGQARPGGVYGTKARPLPLEVASHRLTVALTLLLGAGRVPLKQVKHLQRRSRSGEREPPLGRLGGQLDVTDETQLLEAADEEPRDVELPRAQPVPGVGGKVLFAYTFSSDS